MPTDPRARIVADQKRLYEVGRRQSGEDRRAVPKRQQPARERITSPQTPGVEVMGLVQAAALADRLKLGRGRTAVPATPPQTAVPSSLRRKPRIPASAHRASRFGVQTCAEETPPFTPKIINDDGLWLDLEFWLRIGA